MLYMVSVPLSFWKKDIQVSSNPKSHLKAYLLGAISDLKECFISKNLGYK